MLIPNDKKRHVSFSDGEISHEPRESRRKDKNDIKIKKKDSNDKQLTRRTISDDEVVASYERRLGHCVAWRGSLDLRSKRLRCGLGEKRCISLGDNFFNFPLKKTNYFFISSTPSISFDKLFRRFDN